MPVFSGWAASHAAVELVEIEAGIQPRRTAHPAGAEAQTVIGGGTQRVERGAVLQRGLAVIVHVFGGTRGHDAQHLVAGTGRMATRNHAAGMAAVIAQQPPCRGAAAREGSVRHPLSGPGGHTDIIDKDFARIQEAEDEFVIAGERTGVAPLDAGSLVLA